VNAQIQVGELADGCRTGPVAVRVLLPAIFDDGPTLARREGKRQDVPNSEGLSHPSRLHILRGGFKFQLQRSGRRQHTHSTRFRAGHFQGLVGRSLPAVAPFTSDL